MTTLKNLVNEINNKRANIEKYEKFITNNPLSVIRAEMEDSISRWKKEIQELRIKLEAIELS